MSNTDSVARPEAQWHRREDVRKILQNTRYKSDQEEATLKIQKAASGDGGAQQLPKASSGSGSTGSSTVSFVPGPYAIAHHLISTWANQGPVMTQSNY